jgi:hypothetical protein
MSRQVSPYFTTLSPNLPIRGALCAHGSHGAILYALNRGLPRGTPSLADRILSVSLGSQTSSGARTFTVHFHS